MRAAIAVGLVAAAFFAALAFASARSLWHRDALDYAQIAREVAAGNGFTSRQAIYALHLRFVKDHEGVDAPWPNLHRFPLQSLVLVPFFLLLGPTLVAILAAGVAFAAATAALLFRVADARLGRAPAIALVLLFALNGALFYEVAAGVPEYATCFFFLLALVLLLESGESERAGALTVAAGVALGLAVLARTNVATAVPGVAIASWQIAPRARGRHLALLLVGVVAVLLPWAVRNTIVTGSPTFSLHSFFLLPSASLAGESKKDFLVPWVRDFTSPVDFAVAHPRAVWAKWSRQVGDSVRSYPYFGETLVVPVLAWLALLPGIVGRLRPLATAVCIGVVANLAFCGLTDANLPRYSYFLLPPMMLLAIAVVWRGTRRWAARRRVAALFAATLVLAAPHRLVAAFGEVRHKSELVPPAEDLAVLQARTGPNAIVYSNASHFVTWYTGRRSVRFHYGRDAASQRTLAAVEVDDDFGPIDAIFLTPTFVKRRKTAGIFEHSLAEPEFQRRFECLTPLPSGSVLCLRRSRTPERSVRSRGAGRPQPFDSRWQRLLASSSTGMP